MNNLCITEVMNLIQQITLLAKLKSQEQDLQNGYLNDRGRGMKGVRIYGSRGIPEEVRIDEAVFISHTYMPF